MIIAFVNIWEYVERTNNCENLLNVKVKRNAKKKKKKKIEKHWFKWSKNRKMGDRRIYKVLSTVDRPIAMWDFCSCSHLGQWEKSALTENTERFSRCSIPKGSVYVILCRSYATWTLFIMIYWNTILSFLCMKRKKNIRLVILFFG